MSEDIRQRISDELQRTHVAPTVKTVVETAKRLGGRITPADLQSLGVDVTRMTGVPMCPPTVVEFLCSYLSGRKVSSILDPWAGIGSLLLSLVSVTGASKASGIIPALHPEQVELAKYFFGFCRK